jgi:hypothetical protein
MRPEPNGPRKFSTLAILVTMAKFRGTIRRSDLEGGHWQLVADDGTTYVLEGATGGVEQDGAKVEIDGAVDRQAMGIAMTGPTLKVKAAKKV